MEDSGYFSKRSSGFKRASNRDINDRFSKEDLFQLNYNDLKNSRKYSHLRYGFRDEEDFEDFKQELQDFRSLKQEVCDEKELNSLPENKRRNFKIYEDKYFTIPDDEMMSDFFTADDDFQEFERVFQTLKTNSNSDNFDYYKSQIDSAHERDSENENKEIVHNIQILGSEDDGHDRQSRSNEREYRSHLMDRRSWSRERREFLHDIDMDDSFVQFFDNDEDFQAFDRQVEAFSMLQRRSRDFHDLRRFSSSCDIFEDLRSYCDRTNSCEDISEKGCSSTDNDNEPGLWNCPEDWDYVFNKLKRNSKLYNDKVDISNQVLSQSDTSSLKRSSSIITHDKNSASSSHQSLSTNQNTEMGLKSLPSLEKSYDDTDDGIISDDDDDKTCTYSDDDNKLDDFDDTLRIVEVTDTLIKDRSVSGSNITDVVESEFSNDYTDKSSGKCSDAFIGNNSSQRYSSQSNNSFIVSDTGEFSVRSSSPLDVQNLSDTSRSDCQYTCHHKCLPSVSLDCASVISESAAEAAHPLSEETSLPDPSQLPSSERHDVSDMSSDVAASEKDETDSGYRSGTIPDDKLPKKPSEATLNREELKKLIYLYNAKFPAANMAMSEDRGEHFEGFIKVTLNLVRPITMSLGARPPSIYEVLTREHIVEQNTTQVAFYMPRDTMKSIHISSHETTKEVIASLLKKFHILDHPRKFAMYEQELCNRKIVKLRRVGDKESPLRVCLSWDVETENHHRLVIQENETGEIEWDAFSTPELMNFLKVLDREQKECVAQLQYKYKVMKRIIKQRLKEFRTELKRRTSSSSTAPITGSTSSSSMA